MIKLFNCTTFIETGTYRGETTKLALPLFKEIHTIELSKNHYKHVKKRMKKHKHVHCYHGDSAVILPSLLQKHKTKNLLIFLDAHWSMIDTARGLKDTPISEELQAIIKIQPKRFVLLIDDIHDFIGTSTNTPGHTDYPLLREIVANLKDAFPLHEFHLIGSMGLFCPKTDDLTISPVIKACTISRFWEKISDLSIISNEQALIKTAQTQEANHLLALQKRYSSKTFPHRSMFYDYWAGLVYLGRANLKNAYEAFSLAIEHEFPDWRARFFRTVTALLLGDKTCAATDLAILGKDHPSIDFSTLLEYIK